MPTRIPVRFQAYGTDKAPTVPFTVRHWRSGARLVEHALLDTGSTLTVFPRALLEHAEFPVAGAKEAKPGIGGIGGRARLFYLQQASLYLLDDEKGLQGVNLDRIHFTDAVLPTILGRDALRALNGRVVLDFSEEQGFIEIG